MFRKKYVIYIIYSLKQDNILKSSLTKMLIPQLWCAEMIFLDFFFFNIFVYAVYSDR